MRHLWLSLVLLAVAALPAGAAECATGCVDDYSGWAFLPGRYSHDPYSGARVAQYAPPPAQPALPDSRPYASGYHRSRVNAWGPDGSVTTYYRVENGSNRPGAIDAEWERYNDVWQRSILSGGYFGY